jgi:spermidine/putrescine transport system substrate-binding protein
MRQLLLKLTLSTILFSSCMGNDGKPTLRFYSWNEYMDPTVISQFESENNVHVKVSYFANNEEAIAKIEQEWKEHEDTPPYDVFFPSDYMVQYMKNKGLLEKIEMNQMPNVKTIFCLL